MRFENWFEGDETQPRVGWYQLTDGWNSFHRPIYASDLLELGKWIEAHKRQLETEAKLASIEEKHRDYNNVNCQ